jgi:hypothetical protein
MTETVYTIHQKNMIEIAEHLRSEWLDIREAEKKRQEKKEAISEIFTNTTSWNIFLNVVSSNPDYYAKLKNEFVQKDDLTVEEIATQIRLLTDQLFTMNKKRPAETNQDGESPKKGKSGGSTKEVIVISDDSFKSLFTSQEKKSEKVVNGTLLKQIQQKTSPAGKVSNRLTKLESLLKSELDSWVENGTEIKKDLFFRHFQQVLKDNGLADHKWVTKYTKKNARGPTDFTGLVEKLGFIKNEDGNSKVFVPK